MIWHWLMSALMPIVNLVFGLVPDFTVPDISGYVAQLGPLFQWVGWLNKFLPLDLAFSLGFLLVGFKLAEYLVAATIWILSKLHIMGGGSA